MKESIAIIGIFSVVMGVVCFIRPERSIRLFERQCLSRSGKYIVAGVRFAFGAIFLWAAPDCRFPELIAVFGALTIVKGFMSLALDREALAALVRTWNRVPTAVFRAVSCLMMAAGAFLLYVAVA